MVMRIGTLFILFAASVRDIRKREIARWTFAAQAALSAAFVLHAVFAAADRRTELLALLLSLAPGALLLALAFLSREGIGYGDGLLAVSIGPVFGAERMAAGVCLAFLLSAVCSVVLLLCRRAGRKTCLPFVPFLSLAMGAAAYAMR